MLWIVKRKGERAFCLEVTDEEEKTKCSRMERERNPVVPTDVTKC